VFYKPIRTMYGVLGKNIYLKSGLATRLDVRPWVNSLGFFISRLL